MRYGRWVLGRELGRGGQGITYLAEDDKVFYPILETIKTAVQFLPGSHPSEEYLEKARGLAGKMREYSTAIEGKGVAALKVLHEAVRSDNKALVRLKQEIEVLKNNPHRHILRILDSSPADGWFTTTFYSFGTLADNSSLYKSHPLVAMRAFRHLVDAVASLHRVGIIHRDIKPTNIFFSSGGLVLGDFGLVFFADEARSRISETYENVGSRDWMPPWAYGKRVEDLTPKFDVFSLGKVLWAMISGKTVLPLWYHRRPENDLTSMFQKDPHVHLINAMLDGCIRENEQDIGYPTAVELLDHVDRLLEIMNRGGELLRKDIPRICRVCGYGRYELQVDEKTDPGAARAVGIQSMGHVKWRVFACNKCGNAQMFMMSEQTEAWGPE